MSLTGTSLNGGITATQNLITLTSGTGVAVGTKLKIDAEYMDVQAAGPAATQCYVNRGLNGSAAVAHNTLAPVTLGPPADFTVPSGAPVTSYGANGAIAVPTVDTLILLTKASAAAMTLAGPAKDQTNTVTIVAATAAAHTITYTAGIYGDTTSSDVLTMTAKVGSSVTLRAQNGVWGPVALANTSAG